MIPSALITYLPHVLLAAGLLCLLPAPVLASHRSAATTLVVAIGMGAVLLRLVGVGEAGPLPLFLILLLAMLLVAPLLERGRFTGLLVAAIAGSSAILFAYDHWLSLLLPERPLLTVVPALLIIAVTAGLIGSMKLPLHPLRHRDDGSAVWHDAPPMRIFAGWSLASLGLAIHTAAALPQLIAALTAAGLALLVAHSQGGRDALQKSGEGLMAGVLLSLLVTPAPLVALGGGLLAGWFVTRSESIALALRCDDPHHLIGAILAPCLLGLLLPGFADTALLAGQIQWLAAALASAMVLAWVLWPLTMALLGLALPARLVREGVHPR